jgi:rubrerythrin
MNTHEIKNDPANHASGEDWEGNNAAFTCPVCNKVFIVSGFIHKNGRKCPNCQKSTGYVKGSYDKDGHAWIEWEIS